MGDHNRIEAGKALLSSIEEWCRRTRTRETHVGQILFRHPGFVGLLRKRFLVTLEKEAAVLDFLAEHPGGVKRIPLPNPHLRVPKGAPAAQRRMLAATEIGRCAKCGQVEPGECHYPSCPMRDAE